MSQWLQLNKMRYFYSSHNYSLVTVIWCYHGEVTATIALWCVTKEGYNEVILWFSCNRHIDLLCEVTMAFYCDEPSNDVRIKSPEVSQVTVIRGLPGDFTVTSINKSSQSSSHDDFTVQSTNVDQLRVIVRRIKCI